MSVGLRRLAVELKEQVWLAAPMAAVYAGQQFLVMFNTAMAGRLGAAELGAVGLMNGIYGTFLVMGLGVMMGLDPLMSQALGAGNPSRARALLWQGLWLAIGVTAVLSLPLLAAPHLLVSVGVDPHTADLATSCLLIRTPAMLPTLLFIAIRGYLAAVGNTTPLVVAIVLSNITNVPLGLLLVFGGGSWPAWMGPVRNVPALGVVGAAWGMTLSYVVQVVVIAIAMVRLHQQKPLAVKHGPVVEDLKRAVKVGYPIGLQMGAEMGVFALAGVLAGKLGNTALASHQVALTIASLSFNIALAFGVAGSVRVGKAVGARDGPGTRYSGLVALGAGAAFMTCSALVIVSFPRELARLLTDQPDILEAALPLLLVAALFQVVDGVQGVGSGVLRGAGDTRFLSLANIVGHYAVGLPVAVVSAYVLDRGIEGLWWGLCTGLTAVALSLSLRFWWISSRTIQPLENAAVDRVA